MDAAPGLARASAPDGAAVWQLEQPVGPMRIVGPAVTSVLADDPRDATVTVAPGLSGAATAPGSRTGPTTTAPDGRRLELAEARDPRWRATLDGVPLAAVPADTQTFDLPDSGGTLHVWYDDPAHRNWQFLQLALLILVGLLAFPGVARGAELAARGPEGMGR